MADRRNRRRERRQKVLMHAIDVSVPSVVEGLESGYAVERLEARVLLSGYTLMTLAHSGSNVTGANPNSALVTDASGNLYGTTASGGAGGHGTIFEVDHLTGQIITLASEDTGGFGDGLVMDASGNLYGTVTNYDSADGGMVPSVFELSKASESNWTLHNIASFDIGTSVGSTLAIDAGGNIYGTAYYGGANPGSVFELSEGSDSTWTLTTLVWGNGIGIGALDKNGNIYGSMYSTPGPSGSGSIFELSKEITSNWTLTTLVSFPQNSGSLGDFVVDAAGNLYGAAFESYGYTIFEVAKASGSNWAFTTLTTFGADTNPNPGLVLDGSGNLYGTASEAGNGAVTVFELSKNDSTWTVSTLALFDGAYGTTPDAGIVMDREGNLDGTTQIGGVNGLGTVFQLSKGSGSSWALTSLAAFDPKVGGFAEPDQLVLDTYGNLFDITAYGAGDMSTRYQAFELASGRGSITLLSGADFGPFGDSFSPISLVSDASGNIFGTTPSAFFELSKGSGSNWTVSDLATFDDSVGPPQGRLTLDGKGNLYGTTSNTVFELSRDSASNWTITTIASFDPRLVLPSLVMDASGNLYGVTDDYDGKGGYTGRSIFELSKDDGSNWTMSIIESFTPYQGPQGLLIDASGNLYGIVGNSNGVGSSLFELSMAGASNWMLRTIASFDQKHGLADPLVIDKNGNIYGIVYGTGGASSVFELMKLSDSVWTLSAIASFPPNADPNPALAMDANGDLYGTTNGLGPGDGTIFELVAQPGQITGEVWVDANHNGTQEPGESGLAGVTIFLDLKGDGKLDPGDPTTTTDSDGVFTFTGLHPGTYTVRQVLPDGYAATAPRGYAGTVTLSAGENATCPNFGDVPISSVTLDFSYLVILARSYGQAGTFADGDFNADGKVDFDDLILLVRNYGRPLPALR